MFCIDRVIDDNDGTGKKCTVFKLQPRADSADSADTKPARPIPLTLPSAN